MFAEEMATWVMLDFEMIKQWLEILVNAADKIPEPDSRVNIRLG